MKKQYSLLFAPTSNYMHIMSVEAQTDGINCSSYLAADGLCNFSENYFSRMTSDVSTSGYINVNFSFWWLCGGGPDAYGEVYYSTDMGATWTLCTTPQALYNGNSSTWTKDTLTNASFDNQANIRFGFRFVNGQTTSASDPGFSIDEIGLSGVLATGIAPVTNALSLNVLPNPSASDFQLSWNGRPASDRVTLRVCNLLGETVLEETLPFAERMRINAENWAAGTYLLNVRCGEESLQTKLVKTK